ncbi:right-handed parallel beta-helix repeat-containing protein [Ureibacillus composti]
MNLKNIEAFTNEIEGLLEEYKKKLPKLETIQSHRIHEIQKNFTKPQYVLTVVGSSNSGKSTFINALLGEDLLPSNEETACSLTTTDIVFGDESNQLTKLYENGQEELVEGENLAEVFREEVKASLKRDEINFRYQLTRKLYSFQDHQTQQERDIVLVDTPDIHGMEGLDVKKEDILKVFNDVIHRTDSLLYILNLPNYKSDKNLEILNSIREVRPDLLNHLTVVVNQIDRMTPEDGHLSDRLNDVSNTLISWDVPNHTLYPISAIKALGERLIENQSSQLAAHVQKLEPFLPEVDVEVEGKLVKGRVALEYEADLLRKDSGILQVEEDIIAPIFHHISDKNEENIKSSLQTGVEEVSDQVNEEMNQLQQKMDEKRQEIQHIESEKGKLKQLIEHHFDIQIELQNVFKSKIKKWAANENLTPFSKEIEPFPYNLRVINFDTMESAREAGEQQLKNWIQQETDQFLRQAHQHYHTRIQSKSSEHDFFHDMNRLAAMSLQHLNKTLVEFTNHLKGIRFIDEQVNIPSPEMIEKPYKLANLDQYLSYVEVETYAEAVTRNYLIFFKETDYIDRFAYQLKNAVEYTIRELSIELSEMGSKLNDIYKKLKYVDFPQRIVQVVKDRIQESVQHIRSEIIHLNVHADLIEEEIDELQKEYDLMDEFLQKIVGRTNLETQSITLNVKESDDFERTIRKAPNGATLCLEEGTFTLREPLEIHHSIGIVGVEGKTHLQLSDSLIVKGSNSFFMKDVSVLLDSEQSGIEISGYYTKIENSTFTTNADAKGSSFLSFVGDVKGLVVKCEFSNAETAIHLTTKNELMIESSHFDSNSRGILAMGESNPYVLNNRFTNHQHSAIETDDHSSGVYKGNDFENGEVGLNVLNSTSPKIIGNQFISNHFGISVYEHAKPIIEKNVMKENKVGLKAQGQSEIEFVENEVLQQSTFGIHLVNNSTANMRANLIKRNEGDGLVVNNLAKAISHNNEFSENTGHGVMLSDQTDGKFEQNIFEANESHGIIIQSNATFIGENNSFSENGEAGILAEDDSKVKLLNNTIKKNRIGMKINGKVVLVSHHNEYLENDVHGLSITGSNKGIIENNRFAHNGQLPIYLAKPQAILFAKNQFIVTKWYSKMKGSYLLAKIRIAASNQQLKKEIE